MPLYEAWYVKKWNPVQAFFQPAHDCIASVQKKCVVVRKVEAETLDQVFSEMQGEKWSPNGEARSLIERLGLEHTAMSVGDVVRDPSGIFHECRPLGWAVIPGK